MKARAGPFDCFRQVTKGLFGLRSSKTHDKPTIDSVDGVTKQTSCESSTVAESNSNSASLADSVMAPLNLGDAPTKVGRVPRIGKFRRLLSVFGRANPKAAGGSSQITIKKPQHGSQHDTENQDDEDNYSDDGEPNQHGEDDRRHFKAIRAITRKSLEDLVLKLVYPGEDLNPRTCHVTSRTEGSFNHAVMLRIELGSELEQEYVLKIPAHGTPETWKDEDAFMLRNEAVLVKHIRHHTACPVPEIVAFDETLDNPINAPYILMKKVPGKPATDLWETSHTNADDPPLALEEKRIRFLTSLAKAMSHLSELRFSKIGIPVFVNPEDAEPTSFGPSWSWHSKCLMKELTPIGPFSRSADFFRAGLDDAWDPETIIEDAELAADSPNIPITHGVRQVLDMTLVALAPPFYFMNEEDAQEDGKHFVLRHDDLDVQNIMTDDEGNVTGIIDWDGCMAVPRCIGYTSLPTFLCRDCLPDYTMADRPHLTWSIDRYRGIYSDAMVAACEREDGKSTDAIFTKKSAMYQALLAVLYEDADARELLGKLLAEIGDFRRVAPKDLFSHLGSGWPAAAKVLAVKMKELLAPEE